MIQIWWEEYAREAFAEWRLNLKNALIEFALVALISGGILIMVIAIGLEVVGIDLGGK